MAAGKIYLFAILFFYSLISIRNWYSDKYFGDDLIVETKLGTIKGKIMTDFYLDPFYGFENIPYAKPPIGDLRFKAPQPVEPWSGVLDATKRSGWCLQSFKGHILGKEDCLYLNVYTLKPPRKSSNGPLKSVLVYVHGGGFRFGNPYKTMPGFIMREDIIFVSMQYRLNIFGYLSFEDPKLGVLGNAGQKDQVMALKWVQENIRSFGGDPNSVALVGHSSGGGSTNLLYLSPMAKGLFQRVISMAGCALNSWVITPRRYRALGERLQCNSTEQDEILKCILKCPGNELIRMIENLTPSQELLVAEEDGFGPVIEIKASEEAFLSEPLEDIIAGRKFNDVPFLAGFTPDDGGLVLLPVGNATVAMNFTDVKLLVPRDLVDPSDTKKRELFGQKIKKFYYGSSTPGPNTLKNYIQYYTDVMFVQKIILNAKQQAAVSKSPVYFFRFNYYTELNMMQNFSYPIITHSDEIHHMFIMRNTPGKITPGSSAAIAQHRFIKYIISFVKTGNPNSGVPDPLLNVIWEPVTTSQYTYLEMSPDMRLLLNPEKYRMHFWDQLYAWAKNDSVQLDTD